MGANIALTLIRALLTAPPSAIGSGTAGLVALLSLAVLAGACIASAVLVRPGASELKVVLNALGLAAIAYLTAQALSGAPQTVAWALEGLALAVLAARTDDRLAEAGAAAFAGLAVLHAIVIDAPPSSLVAGAPSLLDAAVALGAIGGVSILASRSHERARSVAARGRRRDAALSRRRSRSSPHSSRPPAPSIRRSSTSASVSRGRSSSAPAGACSGSGC